MPDSNKESNIKKTFGDFAPKLVSLTDDVLFGDVWERKELTPRDRSLITVAALIAGGNIARRRIHAPHRGKTRDGHWSALERFELFWVCDGR